MIRISTIFVAICMALIAASLGLALYAVTDISGQQSAIVALAALTFMILYNAVSIRIGDHPRIGNQIADLSQGTADLARQVGEFGRRLSAIEGRLVSATSASQDRQQALHDEIGELGGLVNQLAETVATHDDILAVWQQEPLAPRAATVPRQPAAADPAAPSFGGPDPAEDAGYLELDEVPPAGAASDDSLFQAVRGAVEANRIDIYLQPIVTLPQRKVRFYEAVARLRDAGGEVLTPDDFIETAEAAGLIGRIDLSVIQRSAQVLRRLMVRNKEVGVFCNLARATLGNPASFAQCLDFLDANRDIASSFVMEFKQRTFRELNAIEQEHLAALAQRGYRFSIDHVEDLRMEPRDLADRGVRFIKVPAGLLLDPQRTAASDIHAADMADLLGRFGIDLIAERIEGERAVVDLLDYDIRFGQGFLFAAPRPLRPEAAAPSPAVPSPAAAPLKPAQEVAVAPQKAEPTRSDSRISGMAALARRALRPS